jgi:hypothetical protein
MRFGDFLIKPMILQIIAASWRDSWSRTHSVDEGWAQRTLTLRLCFRVAKNSGSAAVM